MAAKPVFKSKSEAGSGIEAGSRAGWDIAGGPLFYHGGDLGAARAMFPDAPEPWIDLSTGINPVSYPVAELPQEDWTRLPSAQEQEDLLAAAAARYGAPSADCVVAAPGTQALLQWLPRLFPAADATVLGFTYAEHARCWAAGGATVRHVATLRELTGAGAAVVVNPNNPDGAICTRDELLLLAEGRSRQGGVLVVDEAFMDLMPDGASVAADVGRAPGLIVLRSFGKTYGLAGVRLGFAIAETGIAARLRAALGPWAVAGPAITLGRRALRDAAWLAETGRRLMVDRERLEDLLERTGLTCIGGTPLFVLASHPEAHAVFRRLAELGVLTRGFRDRPDRLRFGIPAPAQWASLEERLTGH